MPPEHTVPAAQTWPHIPQFVLSVWSERHVPLQFVRPAPHETLHVPAAHTLPAGHAVVQLPQCAMSVCVFVHTPEQLVSPA
jgi:hypothetical protein